MRFSALALLLVVVMLVASACGTATPAPEPGPSEEEEPTEEFPSEIKIGVVYPLTGAVAMVGNDMKAIIELAADIVNNNHDLNMLLARTEGLPNLGGAKVVPIFADHQGDPEIGAAETERLITQEGVVAVVGAYHSAVSATASMVCERLGIPYLTGESSSPMLTDRGFQWFFRTSPHDVHFSIAMFDFLDEFQKKTGEKIETIVLLHEDTLFGEDSANIQTGLAEERGYKILDRMRYSQKAASLTSEIQRVKSLNPDVLMPTSYAPDAILMVQTLEELNFNPKFVIAQDAGHEDPTFVQAVGVKAEGTITRSVFSPEFVESIPLVKPINDMFVERHGKPIDGVTSRSFTGFWVLCEAINRAGSTDPEKIRQALRETNISPDNLIMPWRGVKFDETGQNALVDAVLLQLQGGKYRPIWPFSVATTEVIYPMPTWK